jgi:anti-sigma factor RsiW
MNCKYSESELALYAGSDLAQAKMDEVSAHLQLCEACRLIVEDLRETQSAFQSIRQDTVSGSALALLRTSVLEQLAARNARRPWTRWVYGFAGAGFAAVAALGLLSILPEHHTAVQRSAVYAPARPVESPSTVEPVNAVQSTVSVPAVKRVRHSPQRHVASDETSSKPPQEIVVKLLTDDPNIIIYWLVDQNGGSL